MAEVWDNRIDVARAVDAQFPHLLERARREGERFRGDYVDQLAHELNRRDHTTRWGRKARREGDASSLNDDALTFLIGPGLGDKKLIDVVEGDDFQPGWDVRPAHEEPGNGFWHPPVNKDLTGKPAPTPVPEPDPDPVPAPPPQPEPLLFQVLENQSRIAEGLRQIVAGLQIMNQAQAEAVAELDQLEKRLIEIQHEVRHPVDYVAHVRFFGTLRLKPEGRS